MGFRGQAEKIHRPQVVAEMFIMLPSKNTWTQLR
uniref:Uncharacterized protein n=1 Tax=Anguilla anguilla TaxID=7936 RepID=A0A0E9SGH6_ANGAN